MLERDLDTRAIVSQWASSGETPVPIKGPTFPSENEYWRISHYSSVTTHQSLTVTARPSVTTHHATL